MSPALIISWIWQSLTDTIIETVRTAACYKIIDLLLILIGYNDINTKNARVVWLDYY